MLIQYCDHDLYNHHDNDGDDDDDDDDDDADDVDDGDTDNGNLTRRGVLCRLHIATA